MEFAVNAWMTPYTMEPAILALAVEAHGFESLFTPEHTHIPARRNSAYVGGGQLPAHYADGYDPFVALMSAAAATTSLRLGTGICLLPQRDPILLARESATLDRLSGGRVLLGVGAGWNLEELRNHGVDPRQRFRLLAERAQAVRAIWSSEAAEYHGELVSFDPIRQGVRPRQQPGPPILVGLDGPRSIDAVLRYGDGWLPSRRGQWQAAAALGLEPAALLRRRIDDLRRRAEEQDRPRPTVTLNGVPPNPRELEQCALAGVDRVLFVLEPGDDAAVLERLEALGRVAAAVGG